MINHVDACGLIEADYVMGIAWSGWTSVDEIDLDGCQASLWERASGIVCVVRGSGDGWDWSRNLFFLPGWSGKGDSGRLYHRGVLDYARRVYAWVKGKPIDWMTGHSLGGGIGQIVGSSLGIPTYTIAAPKVLLPFQSQPPGAEHVTNAVLPGDPVPWLVPGNRHIGTQAYLAPRSGIWGMRHGIDHYINAGVSE